VRCTALRLRVSGSSCCRSEIRCRLLRPPDAIYDEALDLREIGTLKITRASHVEPDAEGYWWADMGPSRGPVLGPFTSRSEALGAEREWLGTLGVPPPRML
jgi:hypothetical protein